MRRLIAAALACLAAGTAAAAEIRLKQGGWIYTSDRGQFRTFNLAIGDTTEADRQSAAAMMGRASYAAMNGTIYINKDDTKLPVQDGTWIVENHGRPPDRRLDDPRGNVEREAYIRYLQRPDVGQFLENPFSYQNFGEPGDPYYKRFSIPQSEIPEPFRRLSRETLRQVESVLQYNLDGTIKAYLKGDRRLDGEAQRVLESISADLLRQASGSSAQRRPGTYEACALGKVDMVEFTCTYRCAPSGASHVTELETPDERESDPLLCSPIVVPL
ncbi:MAG: hypothetical protein HY078_03065 [Elusimicrobia bacterium]|nr:hypothetical protein [Elusimicrobiota bacterium]